MKINAKLIFEGGKAANITPIFYSTAVHVQRKTKIQQELLYQGKQEASFYMNIQIL